jgi:hypothetical protein
VPNLVSQADAECKRDGPPPLTSPGRRSCRRRAWSGRCRRRWSACCRRRG